jgi:hypothetical protein
MKKKLQIEIVPFPVFQLKKGHKYILLFPDNYDISAISNALKNFFGEDCPLFIIAGKPETLNQIKVLEVE